MNNTTTNTDTQGVEVSKTLKEWLSILPKDVKEKAVENTINNYKDLPIKIFFSSILEANCESLKKALFSAFVLDNTPEGFDYWINVIKVHGTTENK